MPRSVDLGELDADFKRTCKDRDCNVSDGIRQAVQQWIGGAPARKLKVDSDTGQIFFTCEKCGDWMTVDRNGKAVSALDYAKLKQIGTTDKAKSTTTVTRIDAGH
jgi:hypothetical protein